MEGFFDRHLQQVIVDEAQRLPGLFPVLRHAIDRHRKTGQFILLGSAGPELLRTASETLTGRLGILELTPFQPFELIRTPYFHHGWFWGGFPPIHALRGNTARAAWLDSYTATFLNWVFGLAAPRIRTLWTMLTHVPGQLLNMSDLARSLAVSTHTVSH